VDVSDGNRQPLCALSDEEALSIAARGDREAWDLLVDRHAQAVWAIARADGHDEDAATRISHLTWHRLVDHLDDDTARRSVAAWLAGAAALESRRELRRCTAEARAAR